MLNMLLQFSVSPIACKKISQHDFTGHWGRLEKEVMYFLTAVRVVRQQTNTGA
jgi:hypothetical protein